MFLERLTIEGYRHFKMEFSIRFQKGLNVLLGENGCGKTSVIDAIRELLSEDEYGRSQLEETDFHRPFAENAIASSFIQISAIFTGFVDPEPVVFLPWLLTRDTASLTVRVENKPTARGRYRREKWGGGAKASTFEADLVDRLDCVYLPPMRDAEAKLREGKGSRLARLLKNLNPIKAGDTHPLETEVQEFQEALAANPERPIAIANEKIRDALRTAIGEIFGQDTTIRFSETKFNSIVENLRLFFYPQQLKKPLSKQFRSLDENSLGYNNLLYLATVLAELSAIPKNEGGLRILLIEEPEAHLHPQLQILLLKYLANAAELEGIQVVVTTHSPVLASAAGLSKMIHLAREATTPIQLGSCGINPDSMHFVSRWLDATKSTLLFARGVLLVEGISEQMLLPALARSVLKRQNTHRSQEAIKKGEIAILKSSTLEDCGVSVINMGGIYFRHFMELFCGWETDTNVRLPIRCAGITDLDPPKTQMVKGEEIEFFPAPGDVITGTNPALPLLAALAKTPNIRLFVGRYNTFEYDLAMEGENMGLLLQLAATVNRNNDHPVIAAELESLSQENWVPDKKWKRRATTAGLLLKRIESYKGEFSQLLAQELDSGKDIEVPQYITDAVNWVVPEA